MSTLQWEINAWKVMTVLNNSTVSGLAPR